jgi:hypothetical protein
MYLQIFNVPPLISFGNNTRVTVKLNVNMVVSTKPPNMLATALLVLLSVYENLADVQVRYGKEAFII